MIVRLHRLALAEIDREVDYYESRHSSLGVELENEIDHALALIGRFPLAAAQWQGRPAQRAHVLARFPFTIPYEIADDEILILALAHTSRRPGYWSKRR